MNDTDNFENFIYNIAKEEVYKLDASAKYPSWFIDYSKYTVPTFSNHLGELIDGKNISIVCHLDIVSCSVPWILSYMGKDDYQQYDFKKEKEIYENIYQKLIQWGKIGSRWKNENNLFKVVKKEYPDALYQYHSEWLGRQLLDIYIPSLRIGIEYQGIQHYEAVDYFGGDKSLEEQKQRDNLKRTKCDQQGVRLIEWRYDEPISKVKLKEKINSF